MGAYPGSDQWPGGGVSTAVLLAQRRERARAIGVGDEPAEGIDVGSARRLGNTGTPCVAAFGAEPVVPAPWPEVTAAALGEAAQARRSAQGGQGRSVVVELVADGSSFPRRLVGLAAVLSEVPVDSGAVSRRARADLLGGRHLTNPKGGGAGSTGPAYGAQALHPRPAVGAGGPAPAGRLR